MPNRTVLADAEQDSVDNQTPQEPSVGSVGSKVEDMPKSTPSIEGPKDDLGSGSKEDAVIHKDTLVPVEVDQPFSALKSEENQQKSAHEAGVLDVSAGKTIATAEEKENQSSTPERASVSDEEATKSKHGSSVNEELLFIDITGKNIDTAEEKKIQRCIRERTAMPDEEATELQHGSSMNEEVSAIDTNVSGGKIIDAAEEEEKQISTHEVAAVPDEEATKSKHGLSVNEEFLSIDPRFGKNSITSTVAFAKESCVSDADSTSMPNGLQPCSGTEPATDVLHLPQKTMQTEENGLEETIDYRRMGRTSTENEKVGGHFLVSEMNSEIIHGEKKNDSEETTVSSVEKLENPTSLHPILEKEKHEQEKQEAGISQVEAIKIPLTQQSSSEEGDTNLTVIEVIQESITLLRNKRSAEDKDMNVLEDLKDESCNNKNIKVSTAVEVLGKPSLAQSAVEVHQNGYDNGTKLAVAEEAIEGLSDSQSLNRANIALLVETKDKSLSTSVILSAAAIQRQAQKMEPFVPVTMIEDITQACSIHKKEIAISSIIVDTKDKALQSQNDLHSEETFMGTTKGDRMDNFESEVNKADAVKCPISRIQFDSSETKDNSNELLQSLECLNEAHPPGKRKDISGNSLYEVENKDVNGLSTDTRSSKDGRLLTADNDLLTLPINNMTTANALGEPGPDLANESLIPKGGENQVTSSNKQICSSHPDQSLQSPDYVNCPKLESWHEESGDDLKTPLLATAEGSPEVKKESVFPSDLNLNDSKVSLERTESERLRMPLRHHLTDVPDTIPKQSSAPTEKGNAQVKSAEDVWESPARLVASPSRKDKQKTRSIFSQCICCPAVN